MYPECRTWLGRCQSQFFGNASVFQIGCTDILLRQCSMVTSPYFMIYIIFTYSPSHFYFILCALVQPKYMNICFALKDSPQNEIVMNEFEARFSFHKVTYIDSAVNNIVYAFVGKM